MNIGSCPMNFSDVALLFIFNINQLDRKNIFSHPLAR